MADKAQTSTADDPATGPKSASPAGDDGATTAAHEGDDGRAAKPAMVEKLFRHTNTFLAENRDDPLLVVEALAAIVVRYAALLGPVAQLPDRLSVLQALIAQECQQIAALAQAAEWEKKGSGS